MFTSQWEHTRNGIVSWNASSWVIIDMDFNGIMKIWGFTFFFWGGEHVPKSDSKCFFQEISTTLKGIHIGLKSRLNIAKEPWKFRHFRRNTWPHMEVSWSFHSHGGTPSHHPLLQDFPTFFRYPAGFTSGEGGYPLARLWISDHGSAPWRGEVFAP